MCGYIKKAKTKSLIQRQSEPKSSTKQPNDTFDPNDSVVCQICLDEMNPGQEVSWSKNKNCCHVFHKECIVDWLAKDHNDCPCCRNAFLKEDEPDTNETVDLEAGRGS
mmetsp:Transcript_27517/g.42309  ORF Transcript_27517/g.42309 Transcript_27517/m.42309 type:complete len:108 (+) Transcript_27517:83-406(+)